MYVDDFHAEFERMGEAEVELAFVRRGRDKLKRVHALRWLHETAYARMIIEAAAKRAAEAEVLRTKENLRRVVGAVILASGLGGVALFLLRTAMFH
jgi:hypothetical protein